MSIAHFVSILWYSGNKFMCRHGWETILDFTLLWRRAHEAHRRALVREIVKLAFREIFPHLQHFFRSCFFFCSKTLEFENFCHVNNNFAISLAFNIFYDEIQIGRKSEKVLVKPFKRHKSQSIFQFYWLLKVLWGFYRRTIIARMCNLFKCLLGETFRFELRVII